MSPEFLPASLPKAPTPDELAALRAVRQNPRDQALIELMAGCGLRVSEACGRTLRHLHLDTDVPLLRFHGKRGRERVVPLNLHTQQVLRAWLERRSPRVSACGSAPPARPGLPGWRSPQEPGGRRAN